MHSAGAGALPINSSITACSSSSETHYLHSITTHTRTFLIKRMSMILMIGVFAALFSSPHPPRDPCSRWAQSVAATYGRAITSFFSSIEENQRYISHTLSVFLRFPRSSIPRRLGVHAVFAAVGIYLLLVGCWTVASLLATFPPSSCRQSFPDFLGLRLSCCRQKYMSDRNLALSGSTRS